MQPENRTCAGRSWCHGVLHRSLRQGQAVALQAARDDESESPLFVGRAVAALAADQNVMNRTGMLFSSWELAHDYKFADYDGRRPDWGRHAIDFSMFPPVFIDYFRTGADLQIKWLTTLLTRARSSARRSLN